MNWPGNSLVYKQEAIPVHTQMAGSTLAVINHYLSLSKASGFHSAFGKMFTDRKENSVTVNDQGHTQTQQHSCASV